jgi:hypothetical protein
MYETFESDVFHYSYLLCCTSKTANDRKIFKLAIVLQRLISRKISNYQDMYALIIVDTDLRKRIVVYSKPVDRL